MSLADSCHSHLGAALEIGRDVFCSDWICRSGRWWQPRTQVCYFWSSWWCWPGRWWSQIQRWRIWPAWAPPRPRPSRTGTGQWPSWCPPGHQQSQWCQPHGVCHLGCDRESHRQFHFNSQHHWGGLGGPLDSQCIDTHTLVLSNLYYLIGEKNHDSLQIKTNPT